jgi:hypothetical protein
MDWRPLPFGGPVHWPRLHPPKAGPVSMATPTPRACGPHTGMRVPRQMTGCSVTHPVM